MAHIVTAPAVQVIAGARAHFLEKDAVLPDGVPQDVLERLVDEGMIAELETVETVEVPDGVPAEDWSTKQLEAYADASGIDIKAAKNKAEKVAAIAAASA